MHKLIVNRRDTQFFSNLANDINDNQEKLINFIQEPISISSFKNQLAIKKKHYSAENRKVLTDVLKNQLSPYLNYEKVKKNIDLLLQENTFTVTSGHQLNMYGGPLYLIYKIIDSIRLAEKLNERYNDFNFVPIFWMATEDHDFEEINHLHLFRDTFTWNTPQKGPVGRFKLDDIHEFKVSILDKFQNDKEFRDYLDKFYKTDNLATATTQFLMDLVGKYGVIIIDADNRELKSLFQPFMKKEIETQFSEVEIEKQTKLLENAGYHGQAYARPINLFYIKNQLRERIILLENGNFEIDSNEINKVDLLKELNDFPERFSPNVVLRPLYQEVVLPNLCYLGGGGEMAYWLQLKLMFEKAGVPYPLIKVRNSLQWIDKPTAKKIKKLNLDYLDIFKSIHELKKDFVLNNAQEVLDFDLLDEKAKQLTDEIEKVISNLDEGMMGYAKSEITRIDKQIEGIKQKMVRHEKKQSEDAMNQIDNIYNRMFPNDGLQERHENMLPYLCQYNNGEYIDILYNLIDNPFETGLIVYVEE
ncbi:MAG: bacillithiol biosynthesis cysteine-adding enzyme BshC [Brumimicrobium sp.]